MVSLGPLGETPINRPWWALANLVKKVWLAAVFIAALVLVAANIVDASFFDVPAEIIPAGVVLLLLLGGGFFEKVRVSHALPTVVQELCNAIHSYIVEVFCLIAMVILYPTAYFRSHAKIFVQPGCRPILLVHGYMHNSSAWVYIKARFKHANLGPVYTINLGHPGTLRSMEEYAGLVQNKVEAISKETGCDKIVVVGHSMGGVVGCEAATRLDMKGLIEQVITLGSPLKGTRLAYLGFGKCAKEMRYTKDNIFLNQLVERLRRYRGRIHSFFSRTDLIIIPNSSAFVEGTGNTLLADHGHFYYLWSDEAIDKMIGLIRCVTNSNP